MIAEKTATLKQEANSEKIGADDVYQVINLMHRRRLLPHMC